MWEIYSYGAGAYMAQIFNGVAMIFGSDDLYGALRVAAMASVIFVMIGIASRTRDFSLGWLFIIVFVVLGILIPKKDVIITDQLVPANSTVVGNVPLGLAAPAVFFSRFGHWSATTFETVFSLPNEIKYHGNGLLFAQNLVEESTRFEFVTPRLSENYTEFFKSCVSYDLLFDLYTWEQLLTADDIHTFLKTNTSQSRSFSYRPAAGTRSIVNCRTGYAGVMDTDLTDEVVSANRVFGGRLALGDSTVDESVTRFVAAMPVAYAYLTNLSLTQSRIMSQNMISNSLKRGITSFASETGTTGLAQEYASARAEQERRTSFAVLGSLAKRMLPIMQTIAEAIIYASFGIIIILMMLPIAGRVALGYLTALFWINLWAPLYAVLHFTMAYFSQQAATREMVQSGTGFPSGLTAMTHTGLGEVMYDYSVLAGYLSISIPMIAWLLVSRSGAMLAGVAGRVLSSYESPVSSGADETATGNLGLGNSRFETSTAFQQNSAPSSSTMGIDYGDGQGNTTRVTPASGVYTEVGASDTPFSVNYGSATTAAAKSSLSNTSAAEQRASAEMVSSNAALLSDVQQFDQSIRESDAGQSVLGTTEYQAYTQARTSLDRAIASVSSGDSVTMDNVRGITGSVGVQAGVQGNSVGMLSGGIGANLGGSGSYTDKLTNSDQAADLKQALASQEVSEALSSYGQAARTLSANYSLGTDDRQTDSISASLSDQQQASERYSVALQDVTSASVGFENAQQVGSSLNVQGNDGYFNYLSTSRGLSQDQIRTLVNDVNQGNPNAITQNNGFVSDYVQSELSSTGYAPASATLSDLSGDGTFGDRSAGFGAAAAAQNQLLNEGDQMILDSQVSNTASISARGQDNAAAVSSSNSNDWYNREEVSQYPSDVASDALNQMGNPSSLMVTAPGYDSFQNDIQATRDELTNHLESEQEQGLLSREVDKVLP